MIPPRFLHGKKFVYRELLSLSLFDPHTDLLVQEPYDCKRALPVASSLALSAYVMTGMELVSCGGGQIVVEGLGKVVHFYCCSLYCLLHAVGADESGSHSLPLHEVGIRGYCGHTAVLQKTVA